MHPAQHALLNGAALAAGAFAGRFRTFGAEKVVKGSVLGALPPMDEGVIYALRIGVVGAEACHVLFPLGDLQGDRCD